MDPIVSIVMVYISGFMLGAGVCGVILTRRHVKDLQLIKGGLQRLRRVD